MEWRTVKGFEGVYELRNDGLIHSFPRQGCRGGYSYGNDSRNYLHFMLNGNGQKRQVYAHRLVWETFVGDIPQGYDIHHKNGNTKDNRVDNLELIDLHTHRSDHKKETYHLIKDKLQKAQIEKCSKQVLQYTLDGQFVAEYPSVREAERSTNIDSSCIAKCCNGKRKSAGGSIWKYKETAS